MYCPNERIIRDLYDELIGKGEVYFQICYQTALKGRRNVKKIVR
jgi:hypothetical protein